MSLEPHVHAAVLALTFEMPHTISVVGLPNARSISVVNRHLSDPPGIDYQSKTTIRHTGIHSLSS